MTREEALQTLHDWTGVRITELNGMWTVRGDYRGTAHAGVRADLASLIGDLKRIASADEPAAAFVTLQRNQLSMAIDAYADALVQGLGSVGWEQQLADLRARADIGPLSVAEHAHWQALEALPARRAGILAHAARLKQDVADAVGPVAFAAIEASWREDWP